MDRVNFLIVGAMRAGTSTLRDALAQNVHIDIAPGEPMFFSHKMKQGVDYYHSLFDWDNTYAARGEKSPPYAVVRHTPRNVKEYNPDMKIIWLLRNPVKRAVSHFQHNKFRTESALSMEDAIERRQELERVRSPMAYIFRSEYHKQISEWESLFPRSQQHFVVFEELISHPEQGLSALHQFLDVPFDGTIELPDSKNQRVKKASENLAIAPETVARLKETLAPTVGSVEAILGRPIPSWY